MNTWSLLMLILGTVDMGLLQIYSSILFLFVCVELIYFLLVFSLLFKTAVFSYC